MTTYCNHDGGLGRKCLQAPGHGGEHYDGDASWPQLAEPTWLDVMPAIPLARGVPVAQREVSTTGHRFTRRGIVRCLVIDDGEERAIVVWSDRIGQDPEHPELLRVDLDDPQGFGYALRVAHCMGADVDTPFQSLADERGYNTATDLMLSLLVGVEDITDADHLTVAKALAEVMS